MTFPGVPTSLVRAADDPSQERNPKPIMFEVIHAYALGQGKDDYVDAWIDRAQAGSPIVVAFTENIDRHRGALLASRAAADDPPVTAQSAVGGVSPNDTRLTDTTTLGEAGWRVEVVQLNDPVSQVRGLRNRVQLYGQGAGRTLGVNASNNANEGGRVEVSVTQLDDTIRGQLTNRFGADKICLRVVKIASAVS